MCSIRLKSAIEIYSKLTKETPEQYVNYDQR